jgi:Flp pilus assembly protein TadG
VAVPILALMFLVLAGLVVDSGRQLNARARAVSYAEEAARAGAQGVDPASDPLVLDPPLARERVTSYCDRVRSSEGEEHVRACEVRSVDAVAGEVTVRVELAIPSGLLGLVGVPVLRASGEGTARSVIGVR